MTLTTHIAIAVAVARPLAASHPALGLLVGMGSHYLSDAIPHWDYRLYSLPETDVTQDRRWTFGRRALLIDLLHTSLDVLLGTALVLWVAKPTSLQQWTGILAIALGGILPDALQGLYYTKKADFLKPLQQLHDQIHTKIKLGAYPTLGIPMQVIILLMALWTLP